MLLEWWIWFLCMGINKWAIIIIEWVGLGCMLDLLLLLLIN